MIDINRLAHDARTGDRQALERLVRQLQPDVWRYCRYLTSAAEADDLTQETLTRVVAGLGRWERGNVRTWALGVARNVCFEFRRRRDRRRTTPHADAASHVPAPDDYGVVETSSLLAALPVPQREAILLTQIAGLSYADAAEVMGCPVGTIRSRVARGREGIAAALRIGRQASESA